MKLLICRRHVDPGESDIETAWRETEEESGLKRKDLFVIEDFSKILNYDVKGKPKTVIYWLAELKNNAPVILSAEHQAFEWQPLEKACALVVYPEMQELLRDCNAVLETKSK